MDYKSLLFDPIYSVLAVDAQIVVDGVHYAIRVQDKTSGIDVGDAVRGQTILPACVVKARDITALGLHFPVLGKKGNFVILESVWYSIVTYRMRPAPTGENEGEIYLLLSRISIVDLSPTDLIPGPMLDDAAVSALLEVITLLSATVTDDVGVDALMTIIDVPVDLSVLIADDLGLDATPTIIDPDFLDAMIADDTGIETAVILITNLLSASIADDIGIDNTIILQIGNDLVAHVVDDVGLDAALLVSQDIAAAVVDDTGLSATLTVTTNLSAAIVDDTGVAASMLITFLWSAAIADDTGLAAQLLVTTSLTSSIADDTGLAAALTVTTGRTNPLFVNAGVGKLNTTSSSSIAIALPASLVVGNLLIAFIGNNGVVVTSGPAGWTKIEDTTITNGYEAAWYRYVDGTESGTQTFSTAGGTNNNWSGVICQYSGVRLAGAGGPIGALATSTGSVGPRTIPAVTTTDVNSTLVIGGSPAGSAGNFGSVTGFNADFNLNGASSSTGETVYSMAMGSTGTANTAWDSGSSGGAAWRAVIFELIAK